MSGESIWALYEARLRRVSDYIHQHLDEELDNDRLADIACLSPFHWHRIYRAVHGETLVATVKRLRLHRAAGDIVATTLPIAEIAKRSGYPNLQSFNRIFKASYGLPPARYRKAGSHRVFDLGPHRKAIDMFDVTLKTVEPIDLVGVAHAGSYMEIGHAFETLFGALYARDLARPDMPMIGLYLDDPDLVPADKLRSFACVALPADLPVELPLVRQRIDGGDFAVLRHKGPYADMHKAYQWLYAEWLPASGRAVRDAPMFELYINNPREVVPTELLTDIHLPLLPR